MGLGFSCGERQTEREREECRRVNQQWSGGGCGRSPKREAGERQGEVEEKRRKEREKWTIMRGQSLARQMIEKSV